MMINTRTDQKTSTVSRPHVEHPWMLESQHDSSEGQVLYLWCPKCDARRIDLHPPKEQAVPQSRVFGSNAMVKGE